MISDKSIDKLNNTSLKKMVKLLGNYSTSNSDLDKIGKFLFKDKYLGTFASDRFPKNELSNTFFNSKKRKSTIPKYAILNLDKTGQAGSHWVACILLSEPKEVLVYDSFGRKTSKILPNTFNKIKTLDSDYDVEQAVSEDNCGARAMASICVFDKYGKDAFLQI